MISGFYDMDCANESKDFYLLLKKSTVVVHNEGFKC